MASSVKPFRFLGAALVVVVGVLFSPMALAEDGCDKFAWPVAREQALFAVASKPNVAPGGTLADFPKAAFVVQLQPAASAVLVMPPEREPRSSSSFAGTVRLTLPDRRGLYQVTVSDDAWIDLVQEGRYAKSAGSSGRRDCPGLRKSVRVELAPGPLVLQFSDVSTATITVAIRALGTDE